jgi:hypothetical protein
MAGLNFGRNTSLRRQYGDISKVGMALSLLKILAFLFFFCIVAGGIIFCLVY